MGTLQRAVRVFYPRGSVRRVLFGPIRGRKFRVAPESSMGFTFALARDVFHHQWFARHVRKGATVLDIGANRGQMMLYLADFVGPQGRVVCFEPVRQLFDDLEQNRRLNDLAHVEAVCAAVGKADGQEAFGFNAADQTTGKLINCEPSYQGALRGDMVVDVVCLDDFCRRRAVTPHLLKIDVEGSAALVLQGAARVLEQFSPQIYIELHGPEEQAAVQECLVGRGYRAETLAGERVEDVTRGWHSPLWCTR